MNTPMRRGYQTGGRTLSSPVWGGPDEAAARGNVRTARGFQPSRSNWIGLTPPPPAAPQAPPAAISPPPPPITQISAGGGSTEAPRPWTYDPANPAGDAGAGIDPMGGQEIGPGGVPFNWDNLTDAILAAMGPSLTGNRTADILAQIAQAALPGPAGALAGIAGMGARAAAASRAPDDPGLNPWADITYNENGQPVGTRSGRPLGEALQQAQQAASARSPAPPATAPTPGLIDILGMVPGTLTAAPPAAAPMAPTLTPAVPGSSTTTTTVTEKTPSAEGEWGGEPIDKSQAAPSTPSTTTTIDPTATKQAGSEGGGTPDTQGAPATETASHTSGYSGADSGGGPGPGGDQSSSGAGPSGDTASHDSSGQSDTGAHSSGGYDGGGYDGGGGYGGDGGYGGGDSGSHDSGWAAGGGIEGGIPGVDSVDITAQQDEYVMSVPFLEWLNQQIFGKGGVAEIHEMLDQAQTEATGVVPNNADMGGGQGLSDLTSALQSLGGSGGGPGMMGGGGMPMAPGVPGAGAATMPPTPMPSMATPGAPRGMPGMGADATMPPQPMKNAPQTVGMTSMARGGRVSGITSISAARPGYAEGGAVRDTPMVGFNKGGAIMPPKRFADGGMVRDMPSGRGEFARGGKAMKPGAMKQSQKPQAKNDQKPKGGKSKNRK